MDLRSLTYFVKIATTGSITRAADQLGVAQSALSRHVRIVEDDLGIQLLVREPRGVRLTGAGLQFLEHCQRVIRELTLAREELQVRKEVPRGNVVLGITPTISPQLLPPSVERIQQQCPDVILRVVEGLSPTLCDALLNGNIDVAVVQNPPMTRGLTLRPLVSEPIVVLLPPQPRNARRIFTLAELANTSLIVTAGVRAIIVDQLRRIDAKPNIRIEMGAIEPIRQLLLRGVGATALPVSTFHEDIRAGRISAYPIVDGDFQRTLYLAHPAEHRHSASVAEVSRILVAETNALIERGIFKLPVIPNARDENRRAASEAKTGRRKRG